ncbi:hypothetical protein RHO13_13205 (plasmid) [Orbus wheelerorum]|uniref:hypothetical protein n=1 Tax=Orbus wheelerorum TaxID=3074111 RepID=UPI00370D2840
MRMGSDSRVKRSLIYCVCVSLCLVTYNRPAYAVIPQLLWISKMVEQSIANRALQASESQFHQKMLQTLENQGYYLNRSVSNELASSSSPAWMIGNEFSWGAIVTTINDNILNLHDLEVSTETEEIIYISDGVPNGDGTYQVIIEGKEETVKFMPNVRNPVIVKVDKTSATPSLPVIEGVEVGYSLPQNSLYYSKSNNTNLYHYGVNSTVDIAKSYLQDNYANHQSYKTVTFKLEGDNAIYDYVAQGYLFNFKHVGTDKSSTTYSSLSNPNVAGLPIVTEEIFDVTIRSVNYKSGYISSLCSTQTVNDVRVKICNAPEPMNLPDSRLLSDFKSTNTHLTFSDETLFDSALISVNTNYIPAKSSKPYVFGSTADMLDELSLLNNYEIPISKLTALINALMMNAASMDGYNGLPFSSTNLFTEQEIKQAIKDIGHHPTLLDWYGIAADSSSLLNLDPKSAYITIYNNNSTNNNNNNTTNNSNVNKVDWGEFEPPELEQMPDDFLGFFDDLFPFLRDFELDEKKADCPIYHFDAFNQTYTIETHCPLLEQNRTLTEMIMLIVWAFVSLRIILKA